MKPPIKKGRYTFTDCLTWDEKERAELIGGEIVMMAPTSRVHQKNLRGAVSADCQLPGGKKV